MTDSLVVIGSVMGALLIVAFIGIRLLCRAGIRRTSDEGRRRAAKKAERERMKLLKKKKKAQIEEAVDEEDDDDDNDDANRGNNGSPQTVLRSRKKESDSDDEERNERVAEFNDDLATLASKRLLLPKAAGYQTAPPSMARPMGGFVPMPARSVDISHAEVYQPPSIVWDQDEESFAYAPVGTGLSPPRNGTTQHAAVDMTQQFDLDDAAPSEPRGRFRGFDRRFDPDRALSFKPADERKPRWTL